MDRTSINEAVDNISYIRSIIEKTKKSFNTLSKIFILWSLIFVLHSIWQLVYPLYIQPPFSSIYMFINLLANVLFLALATGVLIHITKKVLLLGLEKHLLFIWILILAMSLLPNRMNFSTGDAQYVITRTGHYSTLFFGLGVSLVITRLFTQYKVFLLIGVIYMLLGYFFSVYDFPFMSFLQYLLLPATFLYTGVSLKIISNKEQQHEY